MKTSIPIKFLTIEEDGYHLYVDGSIDNLPVKLLIDTGASRTVFDKEMLEQLIAKIEMRQDDSFSTGLGTNTMQGELTVLKEFSIGDFVLKDYEVAVLNLSHVNATYEQLGHQKIHGVIGSDLLKQANAIISYGSSQLKLSS